MNCEQKPDCVELAEYKMYWPNNPPSLICGMHRVKAENIARALGFYCHFEELAENDE